MVAPNMFNMYGTARWPFEASVMQSISIYYLATTMCFLQSLTGRRTQAAVLPLAAYDRPRCPAGGCPAVALPAVASAVSRCTCQHQAAAYTSTLMQSCWAGP